MEEYENVLIVSVLAQIFVLITTPNILDLVLCILYFMVYWNMYFVFPILCFKGGRSEVLIACVAGQDI